MLKRSKDVDSDNNDNVTPASPNPDETASAPGSAGDGTLTPAEADQLKAQLADKDKELTELKDKYLRTLAESDNVRKRLRQQSEETVRLQRENLLRDLLPIVDNLERAVDAAHGGGNGKPIVEGVEMVLRSLLDLLRAHGVTQIERRWTALRPASA